MGTGGGGRVAVRRGKMDDDDDDEEYVVDEDEEEDDAEYVAAACSDEEDAGNDEEVEEEEPEPDHESDADFDGDEEEAEEDEEDFEIEAPRPKPRVRGRRAKPRDDESDADFDEDEDDELEIEAPRRPKRRPAAKPRARRRKAEPDEDESDADFDEDEELEIETPRPKRAAKARGRARKARPRQRSDSDADSDEDDEPFQIETPRPKRPAKARGRGRKAKKPRDDSDEDFGEDGGFEIVAPRQRRTARVRSRGGRKGKDESDADFDAGEEELEIEARPAAVRSRGGRKGSQQDESDADFGRDEEELQDEDLEIETRPAQSDADFGRDEEELQDEDLEIETRPAESDADFNGDDEELQDEDLEIETHPAESDADFGREEEELQDEDLGIETHPAESDADFNGEEEEFQDEGLELEIDETPQPKRQNGKQDDEFDGHFYEEPEDQEVDEELETEIMQPMQPVEGSGWGRKKKSSGSRRPRHEDDDDYEEEIEDEDEDFDPEVDEEEDVEEEEVEEDDEDLGEYAPTRAIRPKNHLAKRRPVAGRLHRKRRSGSRVSKGKAREGMSAHQRRRKQRVAVDDEEDDDDDFVVNDDVEDEVEYRPRKKAKVGRTTRDGMAEPIAVGETWPSLESDTSEFEFVTSEEEHAENEAPTAEPARIKRKKGRRKKGSESDSSSDSDYVISEEDLKDLGVPMPQETVPQLPPSTSRRTIIPGRVDEKGKELEEALKQICGICLSEEQRSTIQGVLNCCSHYFCFTCILEWSKVESRCPLCKRRFSTITKSSLADVGSGLRNAAIRVEKRDQVYQPTEEEMRRWLDPYENVVCIECNQGGEDNLMLLCDICDSSAHTFCVGLGREVPEGNWYCGGCRSSVEGPSHAQTQDSLVHLGESNMNTADSSSSSFSRPVSNGVFQRPPPLNIHPPSLQGFDLNLSPIETPDEDERAESHISAEAVSTPTGRHATLDRRRALNRRIRILLFRPRTATNAWQNGLQHDRTTPGTEQNQRSICTSTDVSPSCSRADLLQSQQSSSHFVQSASNLTQGTYEGGNNFREVENAKDQLIPIVKKSIKHICARSPLDQSAFMNVARRATNTILALSGISHNRDRVVATPFPFPSHCCHACDGREPAFLMRTICSPCFNSFVGDVVSHIANMFS